MRGTFTYSTLGIQTPPEVRYLDPKKTYQNTKAQEVFGSLGLRLPSKNEPVM